MIAPNTPPPTPKRGVVRVRSFLGYAFLISLLVHVVVLPFFGLKQRAADKAEPEKVSLTKKIKVRVPTPPPPTPTPPPPTPPPKSTPPPVKQTNPPPQVKLKVNPPKTTSNAKSSSSEKQYVPPKGGTQLGVPQGNAASAPAVAATSAPAATGAPATPVATPAPTATPAPKPACAVPNADATTVNAAEAEYPEVARQQGAVGSAAIKVTLDAAGHVTSVDLSKSAGNASLDEAAKRAARASTYSPEIVSCVKTAGSYLFRVDFTGQ